MRVEIRISETHVELSSAGRLWRLKDANRIVVVDTQARRSIHGIATPGRIGDRTDAAASVEGSSLLLAFDAARFDPEISSAATRYWSYQAVAAGGRQATLEFELTRPMLQVFWPAWDVIPLAARRRYLNLVSRWADIAINGRRSAASPLLRRLMRRQPQIFE